MISSLAVPVDRRRRESHMSSVETRSESRNLVMSGARLRGSGGRDG